MFARGIRDVLPHQDIVTNRTAATNVEKPSFFRKTLNVAAICSAYSPAPRMRRPNSDSFMAPPRVDLEADRFAVPVCGFALLRGQATTTIGRAWLCGGIGTLLRGVRAVARDLTFLPLDAMLGAPSLLVAGLELRRELA